MFTIIGGDGREYGPATVEQVRSWIVAGRANLDTKAKPIGSDEWRRLGDFAEFAAPASPPPLPVAGIPLSAETAQVPSLPAAFPTAVPGVTSGLTAKPAERGMRLLARFIDWVIEFVVGIPGGILLASEGVKVLEALMQGRQPEIEDLDVKRLIIGLVVLGCAKLILLVVQVWLITTRGQSIGKRIVGVKIVRMDGTAAGFVHGWLMRELLMSVFGWVVAALPLVGPALLLPALYITDWCMIFRDDHRCLHDLLADTRMVKA